MHNQYRNISAGTAAQCLTMTNKSKSGACRRIQKNPSAFLRHFYRILAILLIGVFTLTCISASRVNAELVTNAKVTASSANVRSAPGTTATNVIATITAGTRVAAGDIVTISGDPSGYNSWCRISVIVNGSQLDGYLVSSYILRDPTSTDSSFEALIASFPESYRQSLRSLHEAHPSWVFRAVSVPAEWNTAVAAESTLGTSLITSSVDDAWKSTEPSAYNALTNTYTPYDGSSWVNASRDIVAYYLDPRNFLSETYVFQFLNLSYDAGTQTQDAVQKLLNNTFMASAVITDSTGLPTTYAQAFMQAGALSGASPYQLVSRVIQEVSAQGSRSTSGTEPGYTGNFNFYNIGASSSSDPVILGLTFAATGSNNPAAYPMSADNQAKYWIPWNSPYRSIIGGGIYISSNYIQKGQNTPYFQKFDVTDDGNGTYRHQYMTNIQAMIGESTTLYNAYSKSSMLDVPLTFNIPVYSNMPEAACAQPAKTGNPNNYLASLAIDGYSLTPTFDTTVTDGYSLIVPDPITSVNITAAAVSGTATVSGTGSKILNAGDNPIAITVTAKNGSVRTYNITVVRDSQAGENLFTTTYRINADKTLAGIVPGTTIAVMTGGIKLANGAQCVFMDASGAVITDPAHVIVTGDRVQFLDIALKPVYDYTALVYGDSNADGKVNSTDLTVVCRYVLKENDITGAALLAADVNHDGKANSTDLTIICRHVLKESTITQ